jgi:hypothetical protein
MILVSKQYRPGLAGAVLALAVVFAGPVAAQQTPDPATPAAQAAPTDPAAAPAPEAQQPEPPASTLAAARDLVVSSGMSRSFTPMVPDLMRQIVPLLARTRPELVKDLNDVLKQLEPEFVKDGERMTDIAAHVYARRMSEDELKAAAAFFETPAGKKYVEVQPGMLDELVVAMQSWTQELSNIMITRVRQEMIKKGHPDI